MNKKWAVVTDFDGTVTSLDISDSLLVHFGYASVEEVEHSYSSEVITEDWMKRKFSTIVLPPQKVEEYIFSKSMMRPHFDTMANNCKKLDIPLEIVSGGLDIYIEPMLKKWKLQWIKHYCAKTIQLNKGMNLDYWFLKGKSLEEFKAGRVLAAKKKGYGVIFCGDGQSDFLAAKNADLVFSTYKLYQMCIQNNIETYKLSDFREINEIITEQNVSDIV
jgi:2-hydroxy-3-keto-5-methylthiopentenyl-1-phosphate phosphatase